MDIAPRAINIQPTPPLGDNVSYCLFAPDYLNEPPNGDDARLFGVATPSLLYPFVPLLGEHTVFALD